jgi:DNA-binding CsgD family transcriptional regulator
LSENAASDILQLALAVADPALADRLAARLAGVPGLRLVGQGEMADAVVVLPPSRSPQAESASRADVEVPLTPREVEVLALLAEGASNKMIARRLGISVHTAKFHVGSLIDKLDAVGRTDAVAHAARLGVIHL